MSCEVIRLKFVFCGYIVACIQGDYGYVLKPNELNMLLIDLNFQIQNVGDFYTKQYCLPSKMISCLHGRVCQCVWSVYDSGYGRRDH